MTLNICDFIEKSSFVGLDRLKELPIEQIEKLWNTLQVKSINGLTNHEKELREKCVEVLENLYRKPWDENSKYKTEFRGYMCGNNLIIIISIF